jgi:DNA-binding transcriptional MerR regulator
MSQNAIQKLQSLGDQVKEAKADMEAKQAELKAHHKAVYMPMCMAKKAAEEKYEVLKGQLKRLAEENRQLLDALNGIN